MQRGNGEILVNRKRCCGKKKALKEPSQKNLDLAGKTGGIELRDKAPGSETDNPAKIEIFSDRQNAARRCHRGEDCL